MVILRCSFDGHFLLWCLVGTVNWRELHVGGSFDVFDAGVQTFRPTLLFSGFRHLVPWSGRGDGGGGAVACDWLERGG